MVDAIFWPDWPQRLADRVAHGSTHHAPDGSTALSYLQAEHNFAWTSQRLLPVTRFYAVLTDRRLIRFGSKINQDIIGIAWSCPRSMVARADVGARWLSFGRLRITFADGSWVLLADINDLGRRRAKAFAAAINS